MKKMTDFWRQAGGRISDVLWVTAHLRHVIVVRWHASRYRGWKRLVFKMHELKIVTALILALIISASPLFSKPVFASTTAYQVAGTGANNTGVGTVAWANPGNINGSDTVYATASMSAGSVSNYLVATNFGFNLNPAAVINGIYVKIDENSATSSKGTVVDNSIKILQGGTVSGTEHATTSTWPSTVGSQKTYGSATDLWGLTWTPAQINSATGFGVAISAKNVKSGGGTTLVANVDDVEINIDYTLNTTFAQASYRLYVNQDAAVHGDGTFSPAASFATGNGPDDVTAADFNGDGHSDLAVANQTDNTLSILFNNGYGSFTLSSNPSVSSPGQTITGDFNGDGKPDLAVVGGATGLSIFLNDGSGGFTLATSPSASSAKYITTADFNGDGHLDLAAIGGANGLSIFLNDGSGGFTLSSTTNVFTDPRKLVAADFNGDGSQDVAVVDYYSNVADILFNNGSGTFTQSSAPSVISGPMAITSADFNKDGHPDLAVTGYDMNMSVLLNNGSGGFTAASSVALPDDSEAVITADFNGDGKPDLAEASYNVTNDVVVFLGDGTGGFTQKSAYVNDPNTYGITTADFNGDGKPDLAVSSELSNDVTVYLGSTAIDVGAPLAAQNTAATVPGDGQPFRLRLDVGIAQVDLAARGQSFKLQYAPMTTSCDTGFSNTPGSAYQDVTDTSTVRYYHNTNGADGIAVAGNTNDPADGSNTTANGGVVTQTYQEKGTANFTNSVTVPAGKDGLWDFALTTYHTLAGQHYCMRMVSSGGATLNTYSAIPEIIMPATGYNQAAYRWYGTGIPAGGGGAITFASKTDYPTGSKPWAVRSGDFNGDGKNDLVVSNFSGSTSVASTVSVYLNNGSGGFGSATTFGVATEPEGLTVGDFNGDGKVDIAVANYWADNVSVLINTTATNATTPSFAAQVTYSVGSGAGPEDVVAVDLNGDNILDLAVSDGATSKISFLIGTGSGTFGTLQTLSYGSSPYDFTVGDFNGDGKKDLAVADDSSTGVTVMLNNTTTGSSTINVTGTNYAAFSAQYSVSVADFNGDGKLDLVTGAGSGSTNNICVMMGSGTGTFGSCTIFTATNAAWGVTTGDFNNDGKPDIAAAALGSGVVSVFTNTTVTNAATPAFGTKTDFTVGSQPQFLVAADLNSDGLADIATPNYGSNTMSVLLNSSVSPVDVGAPLAGNDTMILVGSSGGPFRLRVDVATLNSGVAANGQSFKLQYGVKSTSCSAASFLDVTTTSPIQWYDDPNLNNGSAIAANANDPVDGTNTNALETYQESNPFANTQGAIYVGQDGLWDFDLIMPANRRPADICLRIIKSDGTALSTYTVYPEVQFGPMMRQLMRQGKWFSSSGVQQNYFLNKY